MWVEFVLNLVGGVGVWAELGKIGWIDSLVGKFQSVSDDNSKI